VTGATITPTLATRYAGTADNWASPAVDLVATNLQPCANGAWTIVAYTFTVNAAAVNKSSYYLSSAWANGSSQAVVVQASTKSFVVTSAAGAVMLHFSAYADFW
jgi:hypothetical protein